MHELSARFYQAVEIVDAWFKNLSLLVLFSIKLKYTCKIKNPIQRTGLIYLARDGYQ
jgi:hypothetical protein